MNRRRKKKESPVKMIFLMLIAAMVMAAAVYVVTAVFGKIRSDYSRLELSKEEETTHITIDTQEKPKSGWNQTEEGWRYYLDEKKAVSGQWKVIDGYLYHFGEDGIMDTGEWREEGQVFTLHDTKGYLKDIRTDLDYKPENSEGNLDSLARTNAFWCYLKDEQGTSPFKTILYRRTVENKVMELGGESSPERSTRNSLRAYGDYVYFLPKVRENQLSGITEAEKDLCNKLFRMIPGRNTKELIAENVDGYLVLNDTVYYAQAGQICSAVSGTEMATGVSRYSVVIRDASCYLVDGMGNPVTVETGDSMSVGDRVYRIEQDGKIKYVERGPVTMDGKTYYLKGAGASASVNVKQDSNDMVLIKDKYGVQSYCIVDNQIYFSIYVDKGKEGEWYSQIFKTNLEGQERQSVSERFPGAMENMYYYEDEGEIFAEYNPVVWKQAHGLAAVISRDGSIYRINDTSARTGAHVDGNDMLKIVMVKDSSLICLWNNKAIELNAGDRTLIEMTAQEVSEESRNQENETDIVLQPIGTLPSDTQPQTVAPSYPPINNDPVISTDKPGQNTQVPVVPTIPPVTETSEEIRIVPIN